ncbi:MAG: TraR/DksA C4-type zinc finger protein [Mailhella sp.]|nr:TraR/DksA C4-type zinc finger protein [Mailhella sp.]
MAYRLSQNDIDRAVAFHGHMCPGLTLGLRAAEWALDNIGCANDEEIVAITETDMCAVDAIQALVGCTFGKGNLIYRDLGKIAFSFYRRSDGKSARLVSAASMIGGEKDDLRRRLESKKRSGIELSPEEKALCEALRKENIEPLLTMPFEQIYTVKETTWPIPSRARLMRTLICADCGEGVMESRVRLLNEKFYCKDCFRKHDDR